MAPAGSKLILDDLDLKLKDQLAKNSFLGVNEKMMNAFRQQGRTPKLAATN